MLRCPGPHSMPSFEQESQPPKDGIFPATRWTLIHRARMPGGEGEVAMEELCRRYWFPIYAFLRGRGCRKEEAEDVTQGFFQLLLRQGLFQAADAERGRLRSFLLTALKNYHASYLRNSRTQKRGGGDDVLSFDIEDAETRFAGQPIDTDDPEKIYLAAWARTLIEQAREKLRAGYLNAPRPEVAQALDPFLEPGEDRVPYQEFAKNFVMRESSLRVQVFRLRQKLGDLLREEVRQTVDSPEDVTEELNWLKRLLVT